MASSQAFPCGRSIEDMSPAVIFTALEQNVIRVLAMVNQNGNTGAEEETDGHEQNDYTGNHHASDLALRFRSPSVRYPVGLLIGPSPVFEEPVRWPSSVAWLPAWMRRLRAQFLMGGFQFFGPTTNTCESKGARRLQSHPFPYPSKPANPQDD